MPQNFTIEVIVPILIIGIPLVLLLFLLKRDVQRKVREGQSLKVQYKSWIKAAIVALVAGVIIGIMKIAQIIIMSR